MKKIIVSLAAALLAISAYAQPGIVAGITSSATDLEAAKASIRQANNYHVGVAFKMDLGLIGIQPAIVYNVKGQSLEALGEGGIKEVAGNVKEGIDFKTGFVEVPVQIQAGLHFGNIARVYGFVEPFVGYAVTNEINLSGKGESTKLDAEVIRNNWENVKNRLEYGASLGFGGEILEKVQVSVKYFWNLGDLYKDGKSYGSFAEAYQDITSTIKETSCNGICLSVGLFF